MRVKDKILKELKTFMSEGDANACDIYKGWAYNGVTYNYGWHYECFGSSPTYLGKNEGEALAAIKQTRDMYDEEV